jgi:hypothetical protein
VVSHVVVVELLQSWRSVHGPPGGYCQTLNCGLKQLVAEWVSVTEPPPWVWPGGDAVEVTEEHATGPPISSATRPPSGTVGSFDTQADADAAITNTTAHLTDLRIERPPLGLTGSYVSPELSGS